MSNLKELTWEHHKNAERQTFVKEMFSGKITNERYATYLYNQYICYDLLEALCRPHGIMNDIQQIARAPSIMEDFNELWPDPETTPTVYSATHEYVGYMKNLMFEPDRLMAHLYVRHMGDLSGGQMIAKRVPGSGKYYKFTEDTEMLKTKLREKLDDSMADEAKICFEFATKLFQQIGDDKS
jgi:heme oxygenase (biliverdin-producing, ferredoxin)